MAARPSSSTVECHDPCPRPQIYLAGPFTAFAESQDAASEEAGPESPEVIGENSPWRRMLENTAQELEGIGWSVFLPHRDVSRWGWRDIQPGEVAKECLEAVLSSDLVLGLAGESFGTHIELGAALGNGIPTIVIRCGDLNESFFGAGFAESGLVGSLSVASFRDIPHAVASGLFEEALNQSQCSLREASTQSRPQSGTPFDPHASLHGVSAAKHVRS